MNGEELNNMRLHYSAKPSDFLDDSLIDFGTNIARKILHAPSLGVANCFCTWSDLLGFGKSFISENWQLNINERKQICERIKTAHDIVLYYSHSHERIFILNDGAARVYTISKGEKGISQFRYLTHFIKNSIQTHMNINGVEYCNSAPGCRTVLAFGECTRYMDSSTHFDDYVLNYTKFNINEMSSIAKENGNFQVVYNPTEFQMNSAFSKSFILDEAGSSKGLAGSHFYVDQSVIDAIFEYSKIIGWYVEEQQDGEHYKLFVHYNKNKGERIPMGFQFSLPIQVDTRGWQTRVYRLQRFYPADVPLNEDFYFDLDCVYQ